MDQIDDLFRRLNQLNDIGAALSGERDIDSLLERILLAAIDITRADGGTLYVMNEERTALRFAILRSESLNVAMGGTSGNPITLPDLQLMTPEGAPNQSLVAAWAAIHRRTANIADAYTEQGFDFSGTRRFDERTGYRSQSFLTVPMCGHDGEVIGVLQLINATDPDTGATVSFSPSDERLAESLASQAAVALTNRKLLQQQEELFEAFIDLINLAIDEKSQYTGGHCRRVPALTMMLAEAVNATQEGPLAAFEMTDKDRYELKIAGLLHDCGKITTPVHVVDKATKLQTIFDRIALVDTRFEVLKRDAQIKALQRLMALQEPGDATAAADRSMAPAADQAQHIQAELATELAELDAQRDFLRKANIGGEAMSPADQQRVQDIARSRQWTAPDGQTADVLNADEVENLSIRAGTLTAAERQIINHHIVATIRMLEALPWPNHLARVPEYAGGHHERMDGKGYPRGLKREQMSLQARMMGVADIFEALTARDRPYKPGMKLSQAMSIMAGFSRGGHIDPDLFAVFVRSRVYLEYAQAHLEAAQIDTVDDEAVLAAAVPATTASA
jgi:HD-GYP domain-containing protein (c-di-GMP phosphodiesterase class II)